MLCTKSWLYDGIGFRKDVPGAEDEIGILFVWSIFALPDEDV